jgi:hypothetical protein
MCFIGIYTQMVNSQCKHIIKPWSNLTHPTQTNKCLWKLKALLKVKFFWWYLCRGVVLSIDNSVKRNYQGRETCSFCHKDETIRHLFFECQDAWAVWNTTHLAFGLINTTWLHIMHISLVQDWASVSVGKPPLVLVSQLGLRIWH